VPKKLTRWTLSSPVLVIPTLERSASGALSSTRPRIRMPLGRPVSQENRSPLVPTTVASRETRFCIEVTVSRPRIELFESTGRSA
jgi:hypothetical protein